MPWRPDDFVPNHQQPYDYDTQLFERPSEAVEQIKRELRQEYVAGQARGALIARIRQRHPHMREVDDQAIHGAMERLMVHGGWGQAPVSAMEDFGDEVAHQMRGAYRSGSPGGGSTGRHHLDGAGSEASYDAGDVPEGSLSALIREKQANMHNAHTDAYYRRREDRD